MRRWQWLTMSFGVLNEASRVMLPNTAASEAPARACASSPDPAPAAPAPPPSLGEGVVTPGTRVHTSMTSRNGRMPVPPAMQTMRSLSMNSTILPGKGPEHHQSNPQPKRCSWDLQCKERTFDDDVVALQQIVQPRRHDTALVLRLKHA